MEKEWPPVFGMMQRGGQVVINLLANVKQKTIEPFIKDTVVLPINSPAVTHNFATSHIGKSL